MTKNNGSYRGKNRFQNSGVTRRLWRFQHATVLEWSTEVGFSLILSIYKVIYISIKEKTCFPGIRQRVWEICCQSCEKCGFGLVEIARVMMFNRL